MRTVAIIQARMGSTRLPGKVLAPVAGVPMLQHVVSRVKRARRLDSVAVATTPCVEDDSIEAFCREAGTPCIRGSEDDVLDRYHRAAAELDADVVVRVTADCPLIDPEVIDRVVQGYHAGSYDYVANVLRCTYPDGLDTEVFSRESLAEAWSSARLRSDREHVTAFLRRHPDRFRLGSVEADSDWSHLRWTVDEAEDLEFVRAVFARMPSPDTGWRGVLDLLQQHPELTIMNSHIGRNEGYGRSLRLDDAPDPGEIP